MSSKHKGGWLSSRLPAAWKPYAELSRIDHIFLAQFVFWPSSWGLTMSARSNNIPAADYFSGLALFFVTANIMHSVGCVWDDYLDMDLDRQVERTRSRPLAAGTVSVAGAATFGFPQLLAVMYLTTLMNREACLFAWLGIFLLYAPYPLMKRITHWPQAWLGISVNWGGVVAWLCHSPNGQWPAIRWLQAAMWCWVMYYDTVYGYQDVKDDRKAGIKSTAVLFGESGKEFLTIFCVGYVGCLAYSGYLNGQGLPFYLVTIGGGAAHLFWQLINLDINDVKSCGRIVASNLVFGAIIWAGMFLDYVLQ